MQMHILLTDFKIYKVLENKIETLTIFGNVNHNCEHSNQ